MRETYEVPSVEVIRFQEEDVITTSGYGGESDAGEVFGTWE